jgi:hypothetical protein
MGSQNEGVLVLGAQRHPLRGVGLLVDEHVDDAAYVLAVTVDRRLVDDLADRITLVHVVSSGASVAWCRRREVPEASLRPNAVVGRS